MGEEEFLKITPEKGPERNRIQGGREHQLAVASVLTVLITKGKENVHGIAVENIKRARNPKRVKKKKDPSEAGLGKDPKNQEDINFKKFYS